MSSPPWSRVVHAVLHIGGGVVAGDGKGDEFLIHSLFSVFFFVLDRWLCRGGPAPRSFPWGKLSAGRLTDEGAMTDRRGGRRPSSAPVCALGRLPPERKVRRVQEAAPY